MPGIGILSSIDYNADMRNHFEAGLVDAGNPLPFIAPLQVGIGYDATDLKNAIGTLVGIGQVTLIVTFGGFVACNAAILNSSKTFISLVGAAPEVAPPFGKFVGCCSMESHSEHQNRIAWLSDPANAAHFPGGAAFPPSSIGLLYDPNSKMVIPELSHWQKAGGGMQVAADAGSVNSANFNQDFAKFGAGIQAIVISADPYFSLHRNDLIPAANGSTRFICYPLRSYRNASEPPARRPTPGNAVLMGPHHADHPATNPHNAYYRMGVMAETVVGGHNPASPVEVVVQAPPAPL